MTFPEIFQTYIIPLSLFSVMIGLGLSLAVNDLLRILVMPKAVLTGLTGQIILLPILAFTLAYIFNLNPVISIGMILLAACPGGITSNGYVFASRGDIALSVTLTSIASILSLFTIPLLTILALNTFSTGGVVDDFPIASMMKSLAKLTLLPVSIGMLFRKYFPEFASTMVEPLRKLTLAILIFVIVGNSWFSLDTIKANFVEAGLAAIALNLLSMSMGYGLARLLKLDLEKSIAITYEVGVQNLSLALVLANTILLKPEYAIFAIIYGFLMKFSALGFMAYSKKLRRDMTT